MIKKRDVILILIIVFLVFLLGVEKCEGTGKKKQTDTERFKGTTQGVSLAFASGKPLSQFSRGDSVPVEVILRNGGEFDITSGEAKVKLFGVNLKSFNLPEDFKSVEGELHGINQFFTEPGEQRVNFGNLQYNEEILSGAYSFTLRAKACYPYQTTLESKICVGTTEGKETGGESICTIEGEKVKSGDVSSAPVQITSLTEKLFGRDKLQIKFVIKNVGKGDVHLPETNCGNPSEKDRLKVDVNPDDIQCFFDDGENDKGIISLNNGAETVTCFRTVSVGEENFEDKINIRLNYKYIDRTETTFKIFA